VNVLADVGDEMAQQVSSEDHRADPEYASEKIEEQIAKIRHSGCASYGRAERSNDGDEAGQNYGATPVFFVEIVGALEVAAAEEQGIFTPVEGGASGTPNPIADLVPGDGTKHNGEQKPPEGNNASVREDAGGDQKRIARKKKANEEAGFYEDDSANERSASGSN